jgi:hypothetical protein
MAVRRRALSFLPHPLKLQAINSSFTSATSPHTIRDKWRRRWDVVGTSSVDEKFFDMSDLDQEEVFPQYGVDVVESEGGEGLEVITPSTLIHRPSTVRDCRVNQDRMSFFL